MKTSIILVLAFMVVSCTRSQKSTALTAEQATITAVRLANEKASTLFHQQPFVAGHPADFVGGRWLWLARQGFGRSDIQATVELAMDGSTNSVDVQLFNSESLSLRRRF
jgi:hypothetical protein